MSTRRNSRSVSGFGEGLRLLVTPDRELTPVEWFVAEMATDLGLGDRAVDLRCRRILYRLTRWATAEGLPLDRRGHPRPGRR